MVTFLAVLCNAPYCKRDGATVLLMVYTFRNLVSQFLVKLR